MSTLQQANLLNNETMLECIIYLQVAMKVSVATETKVWPVWIDQRQHAIEMAAVKEAEAAAVVCRQDKSMESPSRVARY